MTDRSNPFARRLTGPDTVTRNRHLGWDAGTVDDAQMHADAIRRALRRARASGMILGGALSLAAFTVGIILRSAINAYWPVTCDGTGSLIVCGLRLIGMAS